MAKYVGLVCMIWEGVLSLYHRVNINSYNYYVYVYKVMYVLYVPTRRRFSFTTYLLLKLISLFLLSSRSSPAPDVQNQPFADDSNIYGVK